MPFKKFLEAATGQLPGPVEEPEAPDDGDLMTSLSRSLWSSVILSQIVTNSYL
jgi:hypothetical protein